MKTSKLIKTFNWHDSRSHIFPYSSNYNLLTLVITILKLDTRSHRVNKGRVPAMHVC